MPLSNQTVLGTEHGEHKITHKFFAHIFNIDVFWLDPEQFRLLARRFKLFSLTQIGGKGNNLTPIFGLKPFQDDRCIKAAGIGQYYFLKARREWNLPENPATARTRCHPGFSIDLDQ